MPQGQKELSTFACGVLSTAPQGVSSVARQLKPKLILISVNVDDLTSTQTVNILMLEEKHAAGYENPKERMRVSLGK
eukprot:snap_masked-scaffold_27-processed-gene-2.46-mRNA-1 protein AED:1.00 eAED:1.00 QI:0/0/0/0/1/1/2/0/76